MHSMPAEDPSPAARQMTPEGLYGRRKMLALILRQDGLAGSFRGALDRTMRTLGLQGVVLAR
jgi:putative transposase